MTNHAKHMLIAGIGVLALLVVAGVPLTTAVTYAVVLACPLMMFGMMFMVNHANGGGRGGHDHGGAATDAASETHQQAPTR